MSKTKMNNKDIVDDVFEYFKDYFKPLSSLTDGEWDAFQKTTITHLDKLEPDENGHFGYITIFKNNDIEIKVNQEGEKKGGMFILGINDPNEVVRNVVRLTATCMHDSYKIKTEYMGFPMTHIISQSSSKKFDSTRDMIKYLKEISGYKE